MAKKRNRLSRLVLMVITIIILLIPLALYYVLYVSSQKAYFIDRSRRALASIGGQVVSRIDGLKNVVQNASRKDCEKRDEAGDPIEDLFNPNTIKPFGVELHFVRFAAKPKTETTKSKRKAGAEQSTAPEPGEAKPEVTLAFEKDGSTNRIVFSNHLFSVGVDTEQLLGPVIDRFVVHERQSGGEDLFDKVFIADSTTGQVIFDYGQASTTIANLDDLLREHSASSDKKSGESEPEAGQKPKDGKPAGRLGRGSTSLSSIKIAETDHRLFFQPIELTVRRAGAAADQAFKLTMCGLVRSDHLASKSFSFSYTLLLMAVLLVLMTTVSGPLIKLRLVGPKDRLRKADAVLTVCSAFFGTALLILTVLDLYTYANLENQLDEQLESLAASVDANLRGELASASDQLDALNEKLGEDLSIATKESLCVRGSDGEKSGETEDPTAVKTQSFMEDILGGNGILDPLNSEYPYFNSAMWADHSGQQSIKFTTKRKHTPFISVEKRRFYRDAKEGNLWNVGVTQSGEQKRHQIYLEALNTRTSGENVAVISKLTPDKDYVSALDMKLLSLYSPVLPAGYGFCVIDSSGLVLFHVDDVRNLEENFFDECNNDKLLRAAVQLRQREPVNLQYLGRAHRAFVTPIQDLPWTLIVYRDKQILRTINLEIVTLASIALSAYGLLLIIALALVFLPVFPNSRKRLERIWPNPERHAEYTRIAVVHSALLMVCFVLLMVSYRDALVGWALLFTALAIGHALWLLRETPRTLRKDLKGVPWLADWRRSYALALATMLALGCVAPTIAFFKLVRDEQVRIFIRHGQMSLAQGLEARENQVRSQYDSADPPIEIDRSNREAFVEKRLDRPWDVYDSFFFGTNRTEVGLGGDRPLSGWLCWFLTKCSPFYNETCVETLELVRSGSADTRWDSGEDGNRLILGFYPVSHRNGRQPGAARSQAAGGDLDASLAAPALSHRESNYAKAPRWILTSNAPHFVSFKDPLWWALVAAIALILIGSYFGVRFCANRILLLDMAAPRSIAVCVSSPLDKNYLVLRPPLFNSAELFPTGRFLRIDLGGTSLEEWWRFDAEIDKTPRHLPVVIDRFDTNKDDGAFNLRKLELVERLVKEKRRVLIVSAVDPIALPLSNGTGSDDREQDAERWSITLSSFVRGDTLEEADPSARLASAPPVRVGPWPLVENPPKQPGLNGEDDEEFICQMGDQAEAYYRGVWSSCSRDERLTLFRVAQDGLVSRFDSDLRRLMQWGLVVRDPSLQLRDKSFRRFVLAVAAAEGVNTYRADIQSNWDRLKAPLLLILLGVIAFLFLTQKELYDSTLSLVSALTGGAFALLKLFGMFQRGKDADVGQS